jgi:hypothetical protein
MGRGLALGLGLALLAVLVMVYSGAWFRADGSPEYYADKIAEYQARRFAYKQKLENSSTFEDLARLIIDKQKVTNNWTPDEAEKQLELLLKTKPAFIRRVLIEFDKGYLKKFEEFHNGLNMSQTVDEE